jgi:hypothetical protein
LLLLPGDRQGYVLDDVGAFYPFGADGLPPALPAWPRPTVAISGRADGPSGYTVASDGAVYPFGGAPNAAAKATGFTGRDIELRPAPSGYVLDGFGGLHPFGGAPPARVTATWPGWDIARGVALNPDGNGGYVLDGWGGLHPFAVGSASLPPSRTATAWPGWDIARAVTLTGANAGFTVDGYGATHGFGGAAGSGSWYWGGTDLVAGAEADRAGHGWVVYVDRWGGLHTSPEPTPAVETTAYWPGWSIARDVALT